LPHDTSATLTIIFRCNIDTRVSSRLKRALIRLPQALFPGAPRSERQSPELSRGGVRRRPGPDL